MPADVALALLHKLLDRIEGMPLEQRSRPVRERVPDSAMSGEARAAMHDALASAERAGAVTLKRGRAETAHIITGVQLASADLLYKHLRRTPAAEAAASIAASLRHDLSGVAGPDAMRALDALEDGWRQARQLYGVPPVRDDARRFLQALDAVLRRPPGSYGDLRTLSSKAGLDSKLVESQVRRIVSWMEEAGRIPEGLAAEEACSALGLEKFAHPVLLAGQAVLRGLPLRGLSYAGVAPGDVDALGAGPDAAVILTVENFASFSRHVAEAMTGREIVVYTGGFPSRTVKRALRLLCAAPGRRVLHWGDVDAGGLRIADHLAREAAPGLALHLMTAGLAREHGVPAPPDLSLASLETTEEIATLAAFLAAPGAAHLEQERMDPVAVSQ